VHALWVPLDEARPSYPKVISSYNEPITYVVDRPGHDKHYVVVAAKSKGILISSTRST